MSALGNIVGRLWAQGASIQTKLAFAFYALLALIFALGLVNVSQIEAASDATRRISDEALPRIVLVNEINHALTTHTLLSKRRVQTTDFRQLARIIRSMRAVEEVFSSCLARFETNFAAPGETRMVRDIRDQWTAYLTSLEEVLKLSEQGDLRRAQTQFSRDTQAAADATFAALMLLSETTREQAGEASAQVAAQYARAWYVNFFAIMVGLAAVLATQLWVSYGISRPLLKISKSMRHLTAGRDEVELPGLAGRRDEIGVLALATEAFRDKMLETRRLAKDVGRERSRLVATVRNMPIGLTIFDACGEVILSNSAMQEVFKLPEEVLTAGAKDVDVLAMIAKRRGLADAAGFRRELKDLIDAERGVVEVWRLEEGRSVETIMQPTPDGWMLICEDVTDRVAAEENSQRLARRDALTGLANRLAFQEHIDDSLKTVDAEHPLAVMLVDLDRFKQVNDTLGHLVGDKLLRQVSERLNWIVDEHGLVARLGGDEFAVVAAMEHLPESAVALGERIVEQLTSPFAIDGHSVQIGGSVGVAVAPSHGGTTEQLMQNADLALYEVKEQGRGRCKLFTPAMGESKRELHELEQTLRKAVRWGEFVVHFQPLVDLQSGGICGAEALVRWRHPARGLIAPAGFLPLAEELGLMRELGGKVLETACAAAAGWPEHMKVSVNLSPREFLHDGLMDNVRRALDAAGLDPRRLELEITEAVMLSQTEKTLELLHALRGLGVSVALDDFGAGYSSLNHLQSFPFDRVKIDEAFVQALPEDGGVAAVIEAICALAGAFDIAVTAEGVESAEQLAFVRRAGASAAQGFYFSYPVAEAELRGLLAAGAPLPFEPRRLQAMS